MKAKWWLIGYSIIIFSILGVVGIWVYHVDPFFHYHKPDTEGYYYTLSNPRSQNDGICKHFEYDALITGTSMTENFKTTEMDELFGTQSIKVPFSGGTYKEINDNIRTAIESNNELRMVVRGLDISKFFDEKDAMRTDLGSYPTYLYDKNIFNDVQYLFNKSVVFNYTYQMIKANDEEGFTPGITSFDEYCNWQADYSFGKNVVCPEGLKPLVWTETDKHLSEAEIKMIKENITQNITSLAEDNPDITFYYFFTPYSIAYWNKQKSDDIYRYSEAERIIIELILEHPNIKLFSFNSRTDIITDLNNYKDPTHYGQWINSLILKWMCNEEYMLSWDNYENYLKDELDFLLKFDYESVNTQQDYENDFYAAALLNQEITGQDPKDLLLGEFNMWHAEMVNDQYYGAPGILCTGNLSKDAEDKMPIEEYLLQTEYIGAEFDVEEADMYDYLVFYGKKQAGCGQPTVFVYDADGNVCAGVSRSYAELDEEWHQYVIDISDLKGRIKIIFNGGYLDNTGEMDSAYIFSNIKLY